MLPLADDNHDRLRYPIVTTVLVVLNVAAFLYEVSIQSSGGPRALASFIQQWGVVPLEYKLGTDLPPEIGVPHYLTLLSSMFLHGGWAHLLGNMLYLWIFGDNVEDRMGRAFFVLFYLGTGLAATAAQMLSNMGSAIPMVGASGAISGVLGAYIVMFPRKRVRVLAFYSVFEVPAWVVLGLWIGMQFVSTVGSLGAKTTGGGVAYMAHLGGFVAGVLGALIWRAVAGGGGGGGGRGERRVNYGRARGNDGWPPP